MVFMALDHTRGFLSNAQFPPVDLAHTTPALFFTRWVTHFCAPAFFLLAGVGASLSLARGRSLAQVSRFFLTRGLWLVVLELTLVSFGWDFTLHVIPWLAGVIWALGWSMVFMAALAWLPRGAIAAVGIALIGLHNLTDAMTPAAFGELGWLWRFLHFPDPRAGMLIRIDYPIIPWVGVMAVGYAMGPLFGESPERRQKILLGIGVSAVIGFIGLRWLNSYGDPMPWSVETRGTYTLLSFLRVRKYPPSLAYLLMTLGPSARRACLARTRARPSVLLLRDVRESASAFLRGAHLPGASHRCCHCVRTGRPSEFPFYERRTNGRAPAVVWRRSWLGVRGLGFDRDRSLPDVPRFCQSQSSSPGLVVELLIAPQRPNLTRPSQLLISSTGPPSQSHPSESRRSGRRSRRPHV